MSRFVCYKTLRLRTEVEDSNLMEALAHWGALTEDMESSLSENTSYEEVGDPTYFECFSNTETPLRPAEVAEARADLERELTLEANAKYGDPEDRAAGEILDSDPYDIEREQP